MGGDRVWAKETKRDRKERSQGREVHELEKLRVGAG